MVIEYRSNAGTNSCVLNGPATNDRAGASAMKYFNSRISAPAKANPSGVLLPGTMSITGRYTGWNPVLFFE